MARRTRWLPKPPNEPKVERKIGVHARELFQRRKRAAEPVKQWLALECSTPSAGRADQGPARGLNCCSAKNIQFVAANPTRSGGQLSNGVFKHWSTGGKVLPFSSVLATT